MDSGFVRDGRDRIHHREGRPGVPPQKLYRAGEIIEHTGISRQTLHTYTLLGLITEERATRAGHRLYADTVFGRLHRIQEMKRQRKTLRQIRQTLDEEKRNAERI